MLCWGVFVNWMQVCVCVMDSVCVCVMYTILKTIFVAVWSLLVLLIAWLSTSAVLLLIRKLFIIIFGNEGLWPAYEMYRFLLFKHGIE